MNATTTVLVLAAALSSGCLGSYALSGANDGGVDAAPAVDVAQLFHMNVEPIFDSACVSCHGVNGGIGPAFMVPKPDMLSTLLSYPGLIGLTPETSRVYAKGGHEGPALTADQATVVSNWIVTYNQNKTMTDGGVAKPAIKPVAPNMGANTFDLSVLDLSLIGAKLTFTASMVGTNLELSQITVVTPAAGGLHIVHPLFVTWDPHYNPTPDPIDSFSNLDETVPAASTAPLGPGEVLLPNFSEGMLVSVVFNVIELKSVAIPDGGTLPGSGCKNLAAFQQYAKPTFVSTCVSCHGGNNANAAAAFSLVTLGQAGGDAQACQSALGEINTTTPASSAIYTYTDPNSGITHPFKFAAKSNFADMWISTEK